MHLHSRALRYFDMIRRCGSIREAARRLHVSSSAANRQLLALEDEIGSPLFERLPNGLRLTPTGEILSRHVITVLQDAQRMGGELDALRGIRRGAVDIVAVEALTAAFLPAVLEQMIARHPGVKLSVRIAGSASAAAAVANGDADVALGFVLQRSESLRQLAVGRFHLGAIVAPDHPLARHAQATFAECARYPLVLPSAELSIHWEIKPLVTNRKAGTVVLETGSFELMKELAGRSVGVAFVNRFGIERELKEGRLKHVRLKGQSPSSLGIYVRAGRALPPAVDAFARLAAEEIARRAAEES